MSEESIEDITRSNSLFAPTFVNHCILPYVNFNGQCLINDNISIPKKVKYLYISYKLNPWLRNLNVDFTLNKCLFGSVELTKNTDPNKHKYSAYGTGFNSRSEDSLTNVIIFGTDMSSAVHIDNKNKDILILGEGSTQGLDDTISTAEAKYSINILHNPEKNFTLQWKQ